MHTLHPTRQWNLCSTTAVTEVWMRGSWTNPPMTNGYAVIAESKNHKTYLIPPPVIDPTGGHFLQSPKEGGNRLHVMKRSLALLLVFLLALSCIPLGTVTAFAAENEDSQPPSDTPPTEAPQTEPAETEPAETEPEETFMEAPDENATPWG